MATWSAVIEVAARSIGGLCSRSLNFGLLGTTLETLILRNAIGMEKPELRREPMASGVLMIPIPRPGTFTGIHGLDEVRELELISAIDITATPGSQVQPPPEGDRYLGFVFAKGPDRETVEASLRRGEGPHRGDSRMTAPKVGHRCEISLPSLYALAESQPLLDG